MRRRVPFIAQLEATECGAACMAMVAAFHRHAIPLGEARALCNVSRDGVSALDIVEAAEKVGFDADAYEVGPEELRALPVPAILHWELNHFVVLERASQGGAIVVDPGHGRLRLPPEDLASAVSGVAIVLTPTPRVPIRLPRRAGFASGAYGRALRLALAPIALSLAATVFVELLALAFPLGTRFVFDLVSGSRDRAWLLGAGAALAGAALVQAALSLVPARALAGLRLLLDVRSTAAFVDRLMCQDASFFLQRTAGDLTNRVAIHAALRDSTIRVGLASLDVAMVVAYTALLVAIDSRMGAALFAITLLRTALPAFVIGRGKEFLGAAMLARSKEAAVALNAFVAPEAIRALGAEEMVALRFARRAVERADAEAAWAGLKDAGSAFTPLFDGIARAATFALAGSAALDGQMTFGALAAFLAIGGLLERPMQGTIDAIGALLEVQEQLHHLDEVWTVPPAGPRADPGRLRGRIAFDRVTFRHSPVAPPTLEEISFEVAPGQCVAVVGRSGAGKSTLASLLLGIARPTEGRVLLDGRDLQTLEARAVRAQIGVVLQDGHIFARSVRDNVALHDESLPLARVQDAAATACVHQDIAALESGYDTAIGTAGAGLSGGQKQRLRLARALSAAPSILILDEATSALDRGLEERIQRGLDGLPSTRFVIAHRLETLRNADEILVLDRGRLVDRGTFSALAGRPGLFREMLEAALA